MNRLEIQEAVFKKAIEDEGFRAELVKNPRGAVETILGGKLPDDLKINVLEEPRNTLSIIVPQNSSELSDEDLDNVSGGFFCYCYAKDVCAIH